MNEALVVTSNQGNLLVESGNGLVLAFHGSREYTGSPLDFTKIVRFDLQEWFRYWEKSKLASHIDILDLGFWYFDAVGALRYEQPEEDFRQKNNWGQHRITSVAEVVGDSCIEFRSANRNGIPAEA